MEAVQLLSVILFFSHDRTRGCQKVHSIIGSLPILVILFVLRGLLRNYFCNFTFFVEPK